MTDTTLEDNIQHFKELQDAMYYRHQQEKASLEVAFLDLFSEFSVGQQFIYKGDAATIVHVYAVQDYGEFVPEEAGTDIHYLLDIPEWRIEDQPDLKVDWSQNAIKRGLENGQLRLLPSVPSQAPT